MRLLLVLAGCCSLALPLHAAEIPEWSIRDICKGEGFEGRCQLLERNARNTISGGWGVLPDSYRTNCLNEVRDEYDQSYRLLSQCLEAQALSGLDKDLPGTGTVDGSITVADAGGAASQLTPDRYDILKTDDLQSLLRQRAAWGVGAEPKEVKAPLAAGAVSPLPKDEPAPVTSGAVADPIINPLEDRPPVKMTDVDPAQIASSMAALLKERESWGTAPWGGEIEAQSGGYPILATSDLGALLNQRGTWGAGAPAKAVNAPLAAGAVSPLPKDGAIVDAGEGVGDPIINPADNKPVAKLTAVPAKTINRELAALLKERESWGTAPSSPTRGYALLETSSLDALLKQRAKWGAGAPAKVVNAPLAAGAVSPLPKTSDAVVVADGPAPIINPLEDRPDVTLVKQPAEEVDRKLSDLLSERASWGSEPSKVPETYDILATASLDDLLAQRATWGAGSPAKEVKAPLAAGAVSPLVKDVPIVVPTDNAAPVIVNPLEAREAVVMADQSPASLNKELALLLEERASWGTAPSTTVAASSGSPSEADYPILATSSLGDLLAQRAQWGTGESGSTGTTTAYGYPVLSTDDLSKLLAQRAVWGAGEAKPVKTPKLAAGAVSPLPLETGSVAAASTGAAEPIINPAELQPSVQLTEQSQKLLNQQLALLLKEREGWSSGATATAIPTEETKVAALGSPVYTTASTCEGELEKVVASGGITFRS
ncbi:MAG: hypothetical protein AAFV69_12860, partial [Pseudomonadota bacterium]